MFRKDEHAGALTRGGRMRCCGRVFCCSIMLIVLILVGIVAAFFRAFRLFFLFSASIVPSRSPLSDVSNPAVWVKPPDVTFRGIRPPTSGNEVSVQTGGFLINVTLDVSRIPSFLPPTKSPLTLSPIYRSTSSIRIVRPFH